MKQDLPMSGSPESYPQQTPTSVTKPTGVLAGSKVRSFGDYELGGEIARGGMGVVYKARQISLNRTVAVKMILRGDLASEADVKRFRVEAEAAANLDHPNIVPIHGIGEHDGRHYFSMRLIEGDSLGCCLQNYTSDLHAAVSLMLKVANAVHYAHQRGILHRDLKPSNILLDKEGIPYVTDFGLAKFVNQSGEMTQTDAIMGTPAYMSPEQAKGKTKLLSTASDVFSLGAIFYELLSGRPPFRADTSVETLKQVMEVEPPSPRSFNPKVDRDLAIICLKCLQKNPEARYSSALEFANDLVRWERHEPITARAPGRVERAIKWGRRHPVQAVRLGVSCLLALGLLGLFINGYRLSVGKAPLWQPAATFRVGGLGIYLLDIKKLQEEIAQETILSLSNSWENTSERLREQVAVTTALEIDKARLTQDKAELITTLARTEQTLTATKEEVAKRDARIAELESANAELDKQADNLSQSITNLTELIASTRQKLATSEGNREFLEKELQRLMAEKAELERQFKDIAMLRGNVEKLKEELNIARRLEWIRKGLIASSNQKDAGVLTQSGPGTNQLPTSQSTTSRYDLNVEVQSDGSVRAIPPPWDTNRPSATPR